MTEDSGGVPHADINKICNDASRWRGKENGHIKLMSSGVEPLIGLLSAEIDEARRELIYWNLDLLLGLADEHSLRVEWAQRYLDEFKSSTAEAQLARALLAAGDVAAALDHSRKGIERGIGEGDGLNDALMAHLRLTLDVEDVAVGDEALVLIVQHYRLARWGELRVETDWVPRAEALGLEPELIEAVGALARASSAAQRRTPHPNRQGAVEPPNA